MRRHLRINQAGFSLLEMLIVVGIMSAAAYVALDTVENNTGQRRYELTELRLQKIRRAIVGDPNLVVNGSLLLSGFATDVGRLPRCLDALLTRDPDCDGDGTKDSLDVPSFDAPLKFSEYASGLSFGWRGPYLTSGTSGLFDGWGAGRSWDLGDEVGGNYGWIVALRDDDNDDGDTTTGETDGDETDDVILDFSVKSLGNDRNDGHSASGSTEDYDADQYMSDQKFDAVLPALSKYAIIKDDFRIDLSPTAITVEISIDSTGVDTDICIGILAPDAKGPSNWSLIGNATGPVTVKADDPPKSITFSSSETISVGVRPLKIYYWDAAYLPAGSCTPATDATRDALLASSTIIRSFGLSFVPRNVPSATFRLSL